MHPHTKQKTFNRKPKAPASASPSSPTKTLPLPLHPFGRRRHWRLEANGATQTGTTLPIPLQILEAGGQRRKHPLGLGSCRNWSNEFTNYFDSLSLTHSLFLALKRYAFTSFLLVILVTSSVWLKRKFTERENLRKIGTVFYCVNF